MRAVVYICVIMLCPLLSELKGRRVDHIGVRELGARLGLGRVHARTARTVLIVNYIQYIGCRACTTDHCDRHH